MGAGIALYASAAMPQAKAGVLNFYIFDNPANSNNASVKIIGAIDSSPIISTSPVVCSTAGTADLNIDRTSSINDYINICSIASTSPSIQNLYNLTVGPSSYPSSPTPYGSLINGALSGSPDVYLETQAYNSAATTPLGVLRLQSSYAAGAPIDSTANYSTSLLTEGINGNGLIGTFTIGTTDTVNVYLGINPNPPTPPTTSSVPAPLPVLGASVAFGWARRLKKRVLIAS